MAAAVHGSISVFDQQQEDWRSYVERFGYYCLANGIEGNDKKRAVLLTVCGPQTYKLIRSLVSPDSPNTKSFDEIVELVTKHHCPPPSSIVQRYKFFTRVRLEGESIADYVAALRQMTEFCEFGDTLDKMLRDRLVGGVNNDRIQRRLLAEHTMGFAKALQIAQSMESADKDSKQLKGEKPIEPVLHYNATTASKPTTSESGRRSISCRRCGGNHYPSNCWYTNAECRLCHKKGHIARVCLSKGKSMSDSVKEPKSTQYNKTHYVANSDENEFSDNQDESVYTLFSLSDHTSEPYRVQVEINGIELSMELDSGASLSILSESKFQELRRKGAQLHLESSSVSLKTYTGESLKVLGKVVVKVRVEDQEEVLPILVVAGTGPALMGRNWLSKFCIWSKVCHLRCSDELEVLLNKHSVVFNGKLGLLKGMEAKIHVDPQAKPRFFKPRNVPYISKEGIEKELERLERENIITPVQFSQWAAPIVPVCKSDGSYRICGDYKATVNQVSKLESYPLPKIEDLFADLEGGEQFTKLDLAQAYLQLPLHEDSKQYLTINTHKGLFQYNRLPFGVSSAPAIFQRAIDSLFQGLKGVSAYIDDILVTGKSQAEHLQNLERVLTKLEEAGLRLKQSKCVFMADKVEYLGYVIDKHGLHPTQSKVQAIRNAPTPSNVTELRAFIGLLTYYSKFLPNLATTLTPLYTLLNKNTKWCWNKEQELAFSMAKSMLQSDAVLTHYSSERKLVLACDASPFGVGAVLSHVMDDGVERPIGYMSRTLTKAEKRYSQLDKEALAIVFGVKKFHSYLFGRSFTIESDHQPLYHLLHESKAVNPMASARLQRWALTLSAYQYHIKYKAGKELGNADALSRFPVSTTIPSVPLPGEVVQLVNHLASLPLSATDIRSWTEQDPQLSRVRKFVESGWPSVEGDKDLKPYQSRQHELSVLDGCLLWGSRLLIPPQGRDLVLRELHETHVGASRMKSLGRGYYWWPGMDADIEELVKRCTICQESRPQEPTAPLHPWEWPKQPWHRLHLDFAGPFLGHMFLVLVDAYSKWMDVNIMPSITSSTTVERLQTIFATHGVPRTIVTDNGPSFTSQEFKQFVSANGIKHITTAPYHPSSNGLAERAVQSFKQGLKKIEGGSLNSRVSRFLFRYRITPHTTTGVPPAELLMGRRLRSALDFLHPDTASRVEKQQSRQKSSHDSTRPVRVFQEGEKVYARDFRPNGKKWLEGEIVKISGPLSYQVKTPEGVVRRHVDNLRRRYAEHQQCNKDTDVDGDFGPTMEDTPSLPVAETTDTASDTVLRRSTRKRHPPAREPGVIYY